MSISELIQPRHVQRRALIYVRQSTPHQVTGNQESSRLQYAMQDRAHDLGWRDSDIDIIDDDLGVTAADVNGRKGFRKLAARIALGEIGIVVAYDATRLARNCTHWYQLLDLCGCADCLIADRDGVYDAGTINGRLLLGLKGQISELELHTLRSRLQAGMLSKAKRGELALLLPAGLDRLQTGEVVKHPDASVRRTIALVFETVLQKRAAAGAARQLRRDMIRLPVRDRFGDIQWREPTAGRVCRIVQNPAYAGAFVYGRTRTTRTEAGQQVARLPAEQWRICVRDKYPSYVSWAKYKKIQAMLKDNAFGPKGARGAPRGGQALLQGIVHCGECGHQIAARERRSPYYCCRARASSYDDPICQYVDAGPIDQHVVQQFFLAMSAAEIDISAAVLQEADEQQDRLLSARRDEVARCQYHEQLARRQFDHVDPENRLVAAELERRWESALQELQKAQRLLEEQRRNTPCWIIPAEMKEALVDAGSRLPEIWAQGLLEHAQKKTLLRTLIEKVVLRRVDDQVVQVRIVWRGGATTSEDVPARKNYHTLVEMPGASEAKRKVLAMAKVGRTDQEIAEALTAQGHRGAKTANFTTALVQRIRLDAGIRQRAQRMPHRDGFLTVSEISTELNLSAKWIYQRISDGSLETMKTPGFMLHLFPDEPTTREKIRALADSEPAPSTFTRCKAKRAPSALPDAS